MGRRPFALVVLALGGVALAAGSPPPARPVAAPAGGDAVRLQLAVVADVDRPTVVAVLENRGGEPITGFAAMAGDVVISNAAFYVEDAEGRRELAPIIAGPEGSPQTVVPAGGTYRARREVLGLLNSCGMDEAGVYRVYWMYAGRRSNDVRVAREKPGWRAVAAATRPAAGAATRPVYRDPRTIRGALKAFCHFPSVDYLEQPADDAGRRVAEAVRQLEFQLLRADYESRSRFGGRAPALAAMVLGPDLEARIDRARVDLRDDDGGVDLPPAVRMVRDGLYGQRWRVAADNFTRGGRSVAEVDRKAKVLKDAVEKLLRQRGPAAPAAFDAFEAALRRDLGEPLFPTAAAAGAAATTRPATAPAPAPGTVPPPLRNPQGGS